MRIAAVTHRADRVGGAEVYLDTVLPELQAAGHDVHLWVEVPPRTGQIVGARAGLPCRALDARDARGAVAAVRPDVLFLHGLRDPSLERELIESGRSVFFGHTYHGTCISGGKTRCVPHPTPCSRTLGPGCLAQYFPRRCGGLSPVTMAIEYGIQRRRRDLLASYDRVLTLSGHMQREFVRAGVPRHRTFVLPYFAPEVHADRVTPAGVDRRVPVRLLFAGRMERLKGGHVLIAAVPAVAAELARPLELVMAGEGRRREEWETAARRVTAGTRGVSIRFEGWLSAGAVDELLRTVDLLVVPSLWPEPFGLVGPEAAAAGVPAAAFRLGGIPEWLEDGVTGHLAEGSTPGAAALSAAIVRCLRDPVHYEALRRGAAARALRHTRAMHVAALEDHLHQVSTSAGGVRDAR